MTQRHLTYLTAHTRALLDDLEAFVTRESPSTEKALLDAFAAYLADYAAAIGAPSVEIVPVAHRGNHLRIRWEGTRGEAPLLLLGHYDTVWPAGTLASIPFSIQDGVARGPGVFDMKAGLLQGFWAVRSVLEAGAAHRPIVYLCTSDEEIGSESSRALIEHEARAAHAVFVLEPSFGESGALKTSRKGVGAFRVEVEGKAVHAGLDPFSGISAVEELARLTLDLQSLSDRATGTTVNVGVVSGGTRTNVVPARAVAEVDVRAVTGDEMRRIAQRILDLQPHHPEARVRVVDCGTRPPMERTPAIADLYAKAQQIGASLNLALDEAFVGGGSDGNFCAALGRPVLDGLGAVGGGAHAATEHAIVGEIPRRTALLARLIEES